MEFKSIYGACSFWFNGVRYTVVDTIITDEPKLIEFLDKNPNYIKIEEEPKKVKKGGNNG